MKIKLLSCMAIALLLFNACSKEQHKVEPTNNTETLKYKIDPKKLSEIRGIQLALKNGQNLRIAEETFTEEEFYLYAEALINSLVTNFTELPEQMIEREVATTYGGETFTLTELINFVFELETNIQTDLAGIQFEYAVQGNPFVHLVDIAWESGLSISYIAGGNSTLPEFNTFNMTSDPTTPCDIMALNGHMQNFMMNFFSGNTGPFGYRPNVLFNNTWNPAWTANYIPAYTFTEVTTIDIDYSNSQDRTYYQNFNNTSWIWHRTVQGANTKAPCLPDLLPGGNATVGVQWYGGLSAALGVVLNPNQYTVGNTNGLVLIGFTVEDDYASSSSLQIPNAPQEQFEYWHKVSYVYGRQIELGQPPIGNE